MLIASTNLCKSEILASDGDFADASYSVASLLKSGQNGCKIYLWWKTYELVSVCLCFNFVRA